MINSNIHVHDVTRSSEILAIASGKAKIMRSKSPFRSCVSSKKQQSKNGKDGMILVGDKDLVKDKENRKLEDE